MSDSLEYPVLFIFPTNFFQIVRASQIHHDILKSISIETYKESCPFFTEEQIASLFHNIDIMLNDNRVTFFLALRQKKPIGYAKLIQQDSIMILDKLYFLSECKGKGYGSRLLKHCLLFCQNQPHNEMRLKVFDDNISAVSFYEKNGFTKKKHIPSSFNEKFGIKKYSWEMSRPNVSLQLELKNNLTRINYAKL